MTREQAFKQINETQEFYVNKLIENLYDKNQDCFKEINFSSDTGTGKTKMMAMLCNKLTDKYFVITTLSKGQLQNQIRENLSKLINQNNYVVYGLCDFTANTKLQANDILSRLPNDKEIVWLRDEGHIHTNKWQTIINDRCWKIVNISATNKEEGIKCNFTNTMMLRTVNQQEGTPQEALDKLLEVKRQHSKIKNYNPCAIMRCLDNEITDRVIKACEKRNLKYINITEEDFDMSDLCKDNNEYDVIINKFKIVEGVDIRRSHVLYMTNEPSNPSTTIQIIGRCRRNALLYRSDIDIFEDKDLLKNTRECFVFYNVSNMSIDTDNEGNLCSSFCDHISCQKLKENSIIHVENGQMDNGLYIIELEGQSGDYKVEIDENTGFNVIKPEGQFYETEVETYKQNNSIKFDFKHSNCRYRHGRIIHKGENYIESIYLDKEFIKTHFGEKVRTKFNYATGEDEEDGIDYIPFRKEKIALTLSELEIENFKKDIILRVQNIKEKEIQYIEFLNYEEDLYNRYIRKTPKRFVVDKIPKLQEDFSLCVHYNIYFDNVKNYNLTKDFNQFFKFNSTHIYFNEILEKPKQFKSENEAKEYITILFEDIKKAINQLKFKSYLYINDEQFYIQNFNQVISKYNNKEYSYIVDVFNEEVKRDCDITLHKTTLNKIVVHDYELIDKYYDYEKIINDKESAIVGTDFMRLNKDACGQKFWSEDKAVTSKVRKYCKLNTFIENKYSKQLNEVKDKLYNGKNKFNFDSKCNSCLGYCVEYYSKYLVYGELYLDKFLDKAKEESHAKELNNFLIVRACMLKYKDNMLKAYGPSVEKLIPTISTTLLIQNKYKEFVSTVIKYGQRTAEFVKGKMNIKNILKVGDKIYDPNLSIKHISGLADYINEDTIIDIKCTSSITISNVKQVLAYHYLSTKRSDLNIKKVIVFDAINNKYVEIKL